MYMSGVTEDFSAERARLEEWRLELEKQYRIQRHEQEVRHWSYFMFIYHMCYFCLKHVSSIHYYYTYMCPIFCVSLQKLREQAKKLAHLRSHIAHAYEGNMDEQHHLLQTVLTEMNNCRHVSYYHPCFILYNTTTVFFFFLARIFLMIEFIC